MTPATPSTLHDDPFDLERFIQAQKPVYATVLAELRNARKETHWMWFIFPQIAGLGTSTNSRHFAIKNMGEALAYLQHPILGQRLARCASELLARKPRGSKALFIKNIFGFPDDMKLHASMTLFDYVSPSESNVFADVLDAYFQGKPHAESLELITVLEKK